MNFKKNIAIMFLVFFIAAVNLAHASTVRGMIVREATGGNTDPAQDIPVVLCNSEGENCSSAFYTDSEGMYYFYDIRAGDYVLKIWVNGYNVGTPKTTPPITVPNQPYTDVEKILIP